MKHVLFVNHARRWAFVEVARAGNTTCKTLIAEDNYRGVRFDHDLQVHQLVTQENQDLCVPAGTVLPGYRRFAVWRDPVQRCVSLWHLACHADVPQYVGHWADHLRGCPFAQFADWAIEHLATQRPNIHVRRQADLYSPDDVDDVVPLTHLDAYLRTLGYDRVRHRNVTQDARKPAADPEAFGRVAKAYAADYAILECGKVWSCSSVSSLST